GSARLVDYDVRIEIEGGTNGIEVGDLAVLARKVLAGENRGRNTSLSCLLTDDAAIRALNRQFRGLDEPTDVLAFPDEADPAFIEAEAAEDYLGDIAISLETAAFQATQAGHSIEDELAHLLVHGILHLCGYDHVTGDADAARMRSREEDYLANPAAHHHS
ncbi:MAG: rRNA maturation RNase YbeY, partial [Dehalococcoidia bacterium]